MSQAFCALLAQAGANPDAGSVPQLPSAPWIEAALFESPWTGMGVLVVVGALMFWWFNRMQQGRVGAIVLVGTFAGALGLFLTARFVTTERERLMALTEALVDVTARADLDALAPMLAPDVRVLLFGRERGFTAQSIPRWVDENMRPGTGRYAVKEHSVGQLSASLDGPNAAQTQVRVRVTPEFIGITTGSWWRVHWRKDGDGPWLVTQIEGLQIDVVPQGADVNAQGP